MAIPNKMSDLNNHLFAELERLGDESITGENLTAEINRAKAISDVATQIIDNASLMLKAHMAYQQLGGTADTNVPKLLTE